MITKNTRTMKKYRILQMPNTATMMIAAIQGSAITVRFIADSTGDITREE